VSLGSRLRALRFDGLWWRKFAYLGSVHGPEWWKRYSPPWIAAVIYLCVGKNRRGALANVRRVLGRRGWLRDNLAALDVFINFAHCMNETLEYFSPRPQPVRVDEPTDDPIKAAITRGCGAVLVTCHFGNWDIGARTLVRFGCPFNLVMAREANETTADYVRKAREDAGVHVLLSDASVYGSFNMLRALKRNEVVAMQLDRPLGGDGARLVDFFGAPAWFQAGPIRLARLAGAPIFPVFSLRVGPRHYRIVLGTEHSVARHATVEEMDRILTSIVAEFEQIVRLHADQWFQFAPYWPEDVVAADRSADESRGATREPTRVRAG
jgi:KDO2-lipid IV(A) lauroyltransferase